MKHENSRKFLKFEQKIHFSICTRVARYSRSADGWTPEPPVDDPMVSWVRTGQEVGDSWVRDEPRRRRGRW